jgi:catechol 2,3-dioxygenase-like lactoylglutathione lyase family enzyme
VTSDGLRIEILEDKNQKVPIKHHHVHFFVPESAIDSMQAWYGNLFGAKPGTRGNFKTGYVPGAELAYSKTSEPTVTTKGRVLDHIGFDVNDLDAFLKKAEAAGVKALVPATKNPTNGVSLAFIADPWGTYIELNQRPNQTYLDQM